MKCTLTLLFSLFTCINVFAGHPDEDPEVRDLRQRFMKGSLPTESSVLGKRFSCFYHPAERRNFRSYKWYYTLEFYRKDGELMGKGFGHSWDTSMDVEAGALQALTFGGAGNSWTALRVDKKTNQLISERYRASRSGSDNLELPTISYPKHQPRDRKYVVIDYGVCEET